MQPEKLIFFSRKYTEKDFSEICQLVGAECVTMPTVLRTGPYRFYFYSHEPNEPPHVHVDRDAGSAKFWLEPVSLARNLGFNARELRRLQSIVMEYRTELLEAWHEFFTGG